jgi:uncharacterized membrane protein YhaH (DUF805 family)
MIFEALASASASVERSAAIGAATSSFTIAFAVRTRNRTRLECCMQWYIGVLKKYAVFSGRARRTEFWMFTLFNILAAIVLGILDAVLNTPQVYSIGLLGLLYAVAVLLPGIAVTVRRLHDTNRSGLWILIALVPFVGGIVLFVFCILGGTPGPNQHGADPKGAGTGAGAHGGIAPASA